MSRSAVWPYLLLEGTLRLDSVFTVSNLVNTVILEDVRELGSHGGRICCRS